MSRLILVANRLPVTVVQDEDGPHITWSTGGLATGLRGPHDRSGGLWVGWPGDMSGLSAEQKAETETRLKEMRVVPVNLSAEDVEAYYEGFANGVLWPLFHLLLDRVPVSAHDWDAYRDVNARFAEKVVRNYKPGDTIWVHDYQLLLVPGMLREALPDARIGFFLHIPFPPADLFRALPWRRQVMQGLLGADLIGFHTLGYLRNFSAALMHVLGVEADVDRLFWQDRMVRLGAFPMGVDAARWAALVEEPDVQEEAQRIRQADGVDNILLGVDRMDYTKGIPRRLLAVERVLELAPELRQRFRFIQVAVPSRENVDAYAQYRRQMDETVARINGRFGTPAWMPVHCLYRGFNPRGLAAMYLAANVMLVTPIRDGMNLVCKEYVACRRNNDGVLVLSEFTGAASELGEAVLVNPYDVDGLAEELLTAIRMPHEEQVERMRRLRDRVIKFDVHGWASDFLTMLEEVGAEARTPTVSITSTDLLDHIRANRGGRGLVLLLDYDGTLVELRSRPEDAAPDPSLLSLLERLTAREDIHVHLVSGRQQVTMEQWLGHLNVGLHADHGFMARMGPGEPWKPSSTLPLDWKPKVQSIMEAVTRRTPGSFVEHKTASEAWHWRRVEPEFGRTQAHELRMHLMEVLANAPVQVLNGDKVVEVRLQGVSKGISGRQVLLQHPGCFSLAMGDDRTDEDLFQVLDTDAATVHVGGGHTRAQFRLPSVRDVRLVLAGLLEQPP